jgi:glycosyltransferase involved in cell wall biosynthesis
MMNYMKFSIIIPLYNKAPYVCKALKSVFAQTYTEYEVIIIDDGSTDGSFDIAKQFIDESLKVKGAENSEADTPASRLSPLAFRLNSDWSRLLDKLRVNGLLEYWMSKEYHDQAAEELKKVDWSKHPASVKRMYRTPIWLLKLKRSVMRVGSYVKQIIIKMIKIK